MIRLARSKGKRATAAICGLGLLLTAVGWLIFCLTATPAAGASGGSTVAIRVLAVLTLPILAFATRLIRDGATEGQIQITPDGLLINAAGVLRQPIRIPREHVAEAIVDPVGSRNGEERLRFAVDAGHFLYSSVAGSELAFLGPDAATPNLALLFDHPLSFTEPRRRWGGSVDLAPLRPLTPGVAVAGVLLRIDNPTTARHELIPWLHPGNSPPITADPTLHIGTAQARGEGSTPPPVARQPLSEPELRAGRSRTWRAAARIGVALAFIFGIRQATSLATTMIIAVAAGCIASGIAWDTRLRHDEREGLARWPSFALLAVGLLVGLAAATSLSLHA